MYIIQYANNAKTTLAAPITSTQTTITLSPGSGALFPNPSAGQAFKVTLVSASSALVYEICLCTARSGDSLTVIRAQEGTSGQPFILHDVVGNFDTKGTMDNLVQTDQLQSQYYQYGVATGTANSLAVTLPSNLTVIPDGMYMTVISAVANTGPASLTLTLGTTIVGTAAIVKGNNHALAAGDIPGAGYPMQINWSTVYDTWVLQNPATGIFVSSVPTGAIVQFPAASAPDGYLACAGQLVSRITYAALWTFAQASGNIAASDAAWQVGQFSPGNGSSDFRLPQYGGYFLRSLDQGNGIDPARSIGTAQASQNQLHTHSTTVTDPGHRHGQYTPAEFQGIRFTDASGQDTWEGILYQGYQTQSATTGISVSNANQGGNETRPINVSVLTCIKF